jgi:hypothetical protein
MISSVRMRRSASTRHHSGATDHPAAGRHAVDGSPSSAAPGWAAGRAPPTLSGSDAELDAETLAPSYRTTLSPSSQPG